MSTIIPQKRTVRELLQNAEYSIDFYQREYEWERRNIEELLDDFVDKFSSAHDSRNSRRDVQDYPRYFLGTVIMFKKDGKKQIVDGQQRMTTLTLLLIYFNHLSNPNHKMADVRGHDIFRKLWRHVL